MKTFFPNLIKNSFLKKPTHQKPDALKPLPPIQGGSATPEQLNEWKKNKQ